MNIQDYLIKFSMNLIIFIKIYNISFPISIKSDGRLRNLKEEIINVTCFNNEVFMNYESIYFFNCSASYNETPSSVQLLNYKDFFIDGVKTNYLELTSYAKYLGSNIQEQKGENSYLNSEIFFFNNSRIINQVNNITIEGVFYNNYSVNANLIFIEEKDIPCTMEKIVEEENKFILICYPLTDFEGNLKFAAVNFTGIHRIMYLYFYENNTIVNFVIPPNIKNKSSKGLSIGVIVAIVSLCAIFFSFIGILIYYIKLKDISPSPSIKYVDKSSNNNIDVNGSRNSSDKIPKN